MVQIMVLIVMNFQTVGEIYITFVSVYQFIWSWKVHNRY